LLYGAQQGVYILSADIPVSDKTDRVAGGNQDALLRQEVF
jgi:hypothetical protein